MNENYSGVGERIQLMLDKLKMKQIEPSKKTGMSKTSLNNYISGNRIPDNTALLKLSKLFSVSIEWLLTGEDVPLENLLFYKTYENKVELLQMIGRSTRNYVNKEVTYDEDIYDAHFVVTSESDCIQDKVSSFNDHLKEKLKQIEVTEEEELLVEAYRYLIPNDKEEIKMLMQFKAKNADSLKKKERLSTSAHGEESAVKMDA